MKCSDILKLASKSKLLDDPYVSKIWKLIDDTSLFKKSPDALLELRRKLLRECLDFFSRHSDYYAQLFERLDINPKNAEFQDLAKLAVPSDILRGEGQKQFLIRDVESGGKYFFSSGTTNSNPVKIYRSPLDLAIMIKANTDLFEYVYGDVLEEGKGVALFLASPELRDRLSFVAFVDLTLENKKIPLFYGMKLIDGSGSAWQKLEPDRENILKFLKSKEDPKLFFTAPAGVYLLSQRFQNMGVLRRIVYKLLSGAPPANLGKGGVIVTGGGSKGYELPPYGEIVEISRKFFKAKDRDGKDVPTPFMDVLGMTETLTALIDRFGYMDKVPHPLSQVFLLDPKTYDYMEEDKKEGILGIFNPFVTSWLEVFYPGDIMRTHDSNCYYGKEFVYVRRLTVEEGWSLQRACGGTLEEMMKRE
ncbi:MAG: hypothetical protein QXY19_08045 [Archaeoglobaceae archaeon]